MNTKRIEDVSIKLLTEMSKNAYDEMHMRGLPSLVFEMAVNLDNKLCELELKEQMKTKEGY